MIILPWLILLSSTLIKCQHMTFIGDAIEAFRPCRNGILTMERVVGGPPSKENYWDGIFDVEHLYPNLRKARFTLQLSALAKVTVDSEAGRVISNSEGHHISYFKPIGGYKSLTFRVEGRPFGRFPEVESLTLNGADICAID